MSRAGRREQALRARQSSALAVDGGAAARSVFEGDCAFVERERHGRADLGQHV